MPELYHQSNDPALEKELGKVLNLLYSFYEKEIDFSLDRVEAFLNILGNPHHKLPPVIHIAGTNGKGSTGAILCTLLEASGKTVHAYTSPHLIHPTERIRLAGQPISTKNLLDLLNECLVINDDAPITFFEIFTAAAFLAFSRHPADYIILETGMGGRLDATNVIEKPVCTIITNISKDHEKFLGNNVCDIAKEKAGIIKAGTPCIISEQNNSDIVKVLQQRSRSLYPEPKLYQGGSDWKIEAVHDHFVYHDKDGIFPVSSINLIGAHQRQNLGSAIAAYKIIMGQKFDVKILSPDNQEKPLWTIFWPCRLQKINEGYLFVRLKQNQTLWLDGGHNGGAGKILALQLKKWKEQDNRPNCLIIAMVNRKDPVEFLKPMLPYLDQIIFTSIPNEASSLPADILFKKVRTLSLPETYISDDIDNVFEQIKFDKARILASGSLFFAGYLLGLNQGSCP